MYFCIKTDSYATSLTFEMTIDDITTRFGLDNGVNSQSVHMIYGQYFCSGNIYINSYKSSSPIINSFVTDFPYSDLEDQLKQLMCAEINVMLLNIEDHILDNIDLDVDLYDLGFKKFYN